MKQPGSRKEGHGVSTVDVRRDTADVDDTTVEERIAWAIIDRHGRRCRKDDGTIDDGNRYGAGAAYHFARHVRIEDLKDEAATTGRDDRTGLRRRRHRNGTSGAGKLAIGRTPSGIVPLDGLGRRRRRLVGVCRGHGTDKADAEHRGISGQSSHTHYSEK